MADLRASGRELVNVWQGWPARRRWTLVAGTAVGLAAFAAVIMVGTNSHFAPLMTNLSAEDAAEITQQLQATHVPYELSAGGSAILVPEDQVHELRLRLAGEGLPRGGGVGFEIFNEPSFGASRFNERLNYLRALQGELQRTIRQLEPVRDTRVHIVLPEDRLFQDRARKARASVTLHLERGRTLSAEQVQSVVFLVSSSVSGLSNDQVTVVDSSGRILAKGGESRATMSSALEFQTAMEKTMEERVLQILERVVGPGNVSVRVTADVDFTQTERRTETFDPDSVVMRSEQVSEEQRSGAGAKAEKGIPGARSNLVGDNPGGPALAKGLQSQKRSETRNYEINKVTSTEVRPGARVSRLSVAVLVNGVAQVDAEGVATTSPRTEAELERLTGLVQKAVGFDELRGDQVEVQSMLFDDSLATLEPMAEPEAWLAYVQKLWPPAVALLVVLILGALGWRRTSRAPQRPQLLNPPRTVRELETVLAREVPTEAAVLEPAAARAMPAAGSDPVRAAAVLKGWIGEQ